MKTTETIDAYVTHLRQVATLLNYGEPQTLRNIQKHTSYKIILGIIFHRGPKTSGRDSEKNINKRKDR